MTCTTASSGTAVASVARWPATNTFRCVRITGPASTSRFLIPGTWLMDYLEKRKREKSGAPAEDSALPGDR